MKLCIAGYIPPPKVANFKPEIFLKNVTAFKTEADLILYSDHGYPGAIKLHSRPEDMVHRATLPNGQPHTCVINNLVFFTAVRIAYKNGYTHMLYLEADCRVNGDRWDGRIWEQFFRVPRPLIAGGSMMIYNPANAGRAAYRKWLDFISQTNTSRNKPVPTFGVPPNLLDFGSEDFMPPSVFGSKSAADGSGSCVFINGALGIYDVHWLTVLFPELLEENKPSAGTIDLAHRSYAWDYQIGLEIWKRFGMEAYDVLAHLPAICSTYGENLYKEAELMEMLRSGKVAAIHQVKSEATI